MVVFKRHSLAGPAPGIILGCPPGRALERRVDAACVGWRGGRLNEIVCTGAGGESTWAARRLVEAGIPAEHIFTERASTNTWQNLWAVRMMMEGGLLRCTGPVWIISDAWHLPRALAMARRLGIQAKGWPTAAPLRPSTRGRVLVREAGSWLKAVWSGQVR